MKYIVTINDKNYEVEVEKGQATILKTTQAAPAAVQVVAAPAPAPAAASPANITGEPVKAPMPGTILSIKVTPGTSVKKGETLAILEAMKMENEISAPRDGVVTEIFASKGASVNTGDVLMAIK